MKIRNKGTGEKLNDLLAKTYDAEKGYNKAAEKVDKALLKSFFKGRAQQRYDFGYEIKYELNKLDEDIDKGSSAMGELQRTWMDLKTLFASDDEEAILEEVKKVEKASLDDYNNVLTDENLPHRTKAVLEAQRERIEDNLNKIKSVKDLR